MVQLVESHYLCFSDRLNHSLHLFLSIYFVHSVNYKVGYGLLKFPFVSALGIGHGDGNGATIKKIKQDEVSVRNSHTCPLTPC